MKGSRYIISPIIAIGLLAGSAVGATAQEEDVAVRPPVAFSGQVICGPLVRTGTAHSESWHDGLLWWEQRGDAWRQTVTMSDPRLEGEIFIATDTYTYSNPGSDGIERATITWSIHRIENDGGAWQGPAVSLDLPGEPAAFTPGDRQTFLLTGEGGYAGLTAIYDLVANPAYRPCGADVYGLIFDGDPATAEPFIGE